MIGRLVTATLLVASLLARPAVAAPEPSDSPIFFQEVLWAGSDRSAADEWVELGNQTSEPVDLSGWSITRLTQGGEQLVIALDGLTVPAGGSLLIANNGADHRFTGGESALATTPDAIVSSLSLSNTQLQLKLYRPASPTPTLVDVAGDGSRPFAGSTRPPTSMERRLPVTDGSLRSSWRTTTDRTNVDAGSVLVATPTHAGRPQIVTTELDPQAVGKPFLLTVTIDDPDGEDDVGSVTATCTGSATRLTDDGLGGDQIAGDRRYTTFRSSAAAEPCELTVMDRQGLVTQRQLTQVVYVSAAPLVVNELLPAPAEGTDEAIELRNLGEHDVVLTGWSLDDADGAGSEPFPLDGFVIPAQGFLVIGRQLSKLGLNDAGDEVTLRNPEGQVVDRTSYRSAKKGWSWSRVADQWWWHPLPSLGADNPSLSAGPDPSPERGLTAPARLTARELRAAPPGTVVELLATVVAAPGMVSDSLLYVGDETGVVEVVQPRGTLPTLVTSQGVRIIGRRSSTARTRLILDALDAVTDVRPARSDSLLDSLGAPSDERRFVRGAATLVRRHRRSLTVRVGEREVRVTWPGTLPEATFDEALNPGSELSLQGILTYATVGDEPSLMLRSQADLSIVQPPPAPAAATSSTHDQAAPAVPSVTVPKPPAALPTPRASPPSAPPPIPRTTATPSVDELLHLARALPVVTASLELRELTHQLDRAVYRRAIRELTLWRSVLQFATVAACALLGALRLAVSWRPSDESVQYPGPWPGG